MPIYQYECAACQDRVDVFVRSRAAAGDAVCPQCGGAEMTRVMSQFARARSAGARLDSIDFNQEMGRTGSGDERDFARWARRMGKQYDEELGSDFGQLAERAEAGDDPTERVDPGHTLRHRLSRRRGEIDAGDGAA